MLALLALVVSAFALVAAGCGGDDGDSAGGTGEADGEGAPPLPEVSALPSASCTDIEFEGEGEPQVLIATDMVLEGSSRTQTLQIVEAVRQTLDSAGWKAGAVNVGFQSCARRDGPGRQVGSGQVQPERQRRRRERVAPGGDRQPSTRVVRRSSCRS